MFRIGYGYDVHEFDPTRPLIIGGLEIEHTHGLKGHSDADVLLHAITDAILGAASLGDIGNYSQIQTQLLKMKIQNYCLKKLMNKF